MCWTAYPYLLVRQGSFGVILDGYTEGCDQFVAVVRRRRPVFTVAYLYVMGCAGGNITLIRCTVADGVVLLEF